MKTQRATNKHHLALAAKSNRKKQQRYQILKKREINIYRRLFKPCDGAALLTLLLPEVVGAILA